jgi:hypothetical protein
LVGFRKKEESIYELSWEMLYTYIHIIYISVMKTSNTTVKRRLSSQYATVVLLLILPSSASVKTTRGLREFTDKWRTTVWRNVNLMCQHKDGHKYLNCNCLGAYATKSCKTALKLTSPFVCSSVRLTDFHEI